MNFEDLIHSRQAPPNRVGKHEGEYEHHFYEGAIMIAYAMHLLRTEETKHVLIHPDGEHGKQFDFMAWLTLHGFVKLSSIGTTSYGGIYQNAVGEKITVNPKSGMGDVVAQIGNSIIIAECKGGIVNTKHSGQQSKLYKGLCEAVGLLMASEAKGRQIAVVPFTPNTERLAKRMIHRCALAGIEIALVHSKGEVISLKPTE